MKNITCCLFLAAGSEEKIPLNRIIWDEYHEVSRWKDHEAEEAFSHLQDLADRGQLAVIIDGLDELGTMTMKDKDNAARVTMYPSLMIDMKTACLGILSKKILPGALVMATGRNTELVNKEVLEKKAHLCELVHLTEDDRKNLIAKMEQDPWDGKYYKRL